MLTGKALVESLVDDLNVLGMPNMAATLEGMYSSPGFLEMDHLTLIAELIGAEYRDKISKRVNNRLRYAKLIGCPAELEKCIDSTQREYLPQGIPQLLASLDFIPKGFNVCILGASDAGKTYLHSCSEKYEYVKSLMPKDCTVNDINICEHPFHYRNKVHSGFKRLRNGRIICGPYESGSHRIVEVDSCLIENETASAIIRDCADLAVKIGVPIYNETTCTGEV